MGVPSFYRWLVDKYPKIVADAKEERGFVDFSKPNPNGLEFDNLYLDMNGIIHPCFHPEDSLFPPTTFEEVFENIFHYIDRLFRIVRPRKLLYMAIDGVAPRSKMNQQRSRRFQAAKNAELAEAEEERLRREFELMGKRVLPKQCSEVSDSNVITPGTEFMDKLSKALKHYIHSRLNNDPGWKNIKVILSDANVAGEGEHKIMSFIRLQRNLAGYNPNTSHCLYGLDADLIMLALATHEIHFSILREEVLTHDHQVDDLSDTCRSIQNMSMGSASRPKTMKSNGGLSKRPYQFLNIWTLREYLRLDLAIDDLPDPPFKFNFERVVDDFVFMCFLMGNDFLPHLPTLEIHEGGIDLLMSVYKKEFKKMGGYLIDTQKLQEKKAGYMKKKRLERFLKAVGSHEDQIFEKRSEIRERKLRRIMREMAEEKDVEIEFYNSQEDFSNQASGSLPVYHTRGGCSEFMNGKSSTSGRLESFRSSARENIAAESMRFHNCDDTDVLRNTKELQQQLKDFLCVRLDIFKQGSFPTDKVKLGHPGWKERYYKEKFSAETSDQIERMRKDLVLNYTQGLCWVLRYYYEGVCSWTWYYNYHYGPFASDFWGFSSSEIKFQLGAPFKPFAQLMSVLPPRSAHALPRVYRQLMTSEDSKISYLYPNDFDVDTDGKRYLWQGVTKLPFMEEKLLLSEIEKLENELTDDEVRRNSVLYDRIFVRGSHEFGLQVLSTYGYCSDASGRGPTQVKIPIKFENSGGLNGFLRNDDYRNTHYLASPVKNMEDVTDNNVVFAIFENPAFHFHIPEPPKDVIFPDEEITGSDIEERPLWHTYRGPRPIVNSYHYKQKQVQETRNGIGRSPELSIERDTWKVAGSGWGSGRERGGFEPMNSSQNSVTKARVQERSATFGVSQNGGFSRRSQNEYGRGHINGMSGFPNVWQKSGASSQIPHTNYGLGQPGRLSTADTSDNWQRGTLHAVTSFGGSRGRGYAESSSSNLRWIPKPKQTDPVREKRFS